MIKIGMIIGDRYEILEKIGTGGMSDVYKAKCHKLNRYVAIKVLKQEFSENTNFVSKFRVEAQAAAGLMHPNIVNVYDVGEEDGIYYIVMELVEGITLKNYIEKKARLSVKEALSIAIQVSMGIEAAHNNHIIHRDIKPQNIMISKEGKVKIADFGIAKAATSNTITSNVMGSVHYTSPEQARGGFSDERSDIYSLGCTMFEMLTGRVPFDGETTVAIAIKHIQEDMPSPREYVSEIPVCVEQIIFKCTQKSPDRRYQSMGELIVDLKKALITPDEDFVKMVPFDAGGETRTISEEDIAEIKQRTDRIDLDAPMRLKDREVQKNYYTEKEEEEEQPEKPVRQEQISSKYKPVVEEDPDDMDEEDDEEEVFEDYDYFLFSNLEDIREEILKLTQNREESLKARIRKVLQIGASAQRHYEEGDLIDWDECEDTDKVCVKDKYELFRKHMRFLSEELELLYQDWDDVLVESEVLLFDQGEAGFTENKKRFLSWWGNSSLPPLEIVLEQIVVYFISIYLLGAVYDGNILGKIDSAVGHATVIFLLLLARWIKCSEKLEVADLIELVYRYSREIEHSDENLDRVEELDWFIRI